MAPNYERRREDPGMALRSDADAVVIVTGITPLKGAPKQASFWAEPSNMQSCSPPAGLTHVFGSIANVLGESS